MRRLLAATLLAAIGSLTSGLALAIDHAAIAPYLTDDVVAVGFVNLEKVNVPAVLEELERLKIVPEAEVAEARLQAHAIHGVYSQLPAKGARHFYVLIRPQDAFHGGPSWFIQTESPEQTAGVVEWLKPILEEFRRSGDIADYLPQELRAQDAMVIAARSDRFEKLTAPPAGAPRADAVAALAGITADAGVVYFNSEDGRRVLRELFPTAPAPFMEINGPLLADGVRWAAVNVKLPPQPAIGAAVEAATPEAAATFRGVFEKGAELAKALLLAELVSGLPARQERAKQLLPLMPLLKPAVEGNRVSFTFGDDDEEMQFVANLMPALTQELRDEAQRNQRVVHFKHIALGLLNYESANGRFPAAASYDAAGRPLLSWRVLILPYMERVDLYNKFKHDEPWDSEHNRKLISEMPDFYRDPNPAVQAVLGESGRTTYVLPRGAGLFFEDPEGSKHRDIIDGTSNTILAIEAVPERAVVWTKPEDWQVDMHDPLQGVKRTDRHGFTAAFADGHVLVVPNDVDAAKFKAQLTPAAKD